MLINSANLRTYSSFPLCRGEATCMAYEIRDRNSKATNQSPLPPSSHIETPAAAAMSNAKRSSFKFHDLLRRCAAFLTSSSAGCVRAGRTRDSWLPDDFDRADFLCMQELRQPHLAPIPPCSFLLGFSPSSNDSFEISTLLGCGHCCPQGRCKPFLLAVRILSGNAASQMEATQTGFRNGPEPVRSDRAMRHILQPVPFFCRSLSRRSTTCVGGWTRCRRSTT